MCEWDDLFKMAEKQSLIGVCFAGLQKLGADSSDGFSKIGMSESQFMVWMGRAVQIQFKNETVNQQCAILRAKLESAGFRNYIMKGQAIGTLYGQLANFRQSGDIDVFLEGGLEKVLAYARTLGVVDHVNELEMQVNVFNDTAVEFHYKPFIMRNPFKNRKLQEYFKEQHENCFSNRIRLSDDGLEICAPTIEFNLIHQLAHIRLHLFTEGIGLRQLMDYYFLLISNENVDVEDVKQAIKDLGLRSFASALLWVLQYVFGLDNSGTKILGVDANKIDGQLLLNEVMRGGNFGHHDEVQNAHKKMIGYGFWALFIRNLKLSRFDRSDWFWGPVWRMYHFFWKKINGFN